MSKVGNINDIVFGNPLHAQSYALSEIHYLDTLYEPLQRYAFPANSSEETKRELNLLAARLRKLLADEDGVLTSAMSIHFHLDNYLYDEVARHGLAMDYKTYQELSLDCLNVALKLKYYFKRPRPYQLASYYNLALFPETTDGIDSPGYPCFHYLKSLLVMHVFSDPPSYNVYKQIATNVFNSRLDLGYNYPSDLKFSEMVFNKMIRHKGFRDKYELDKKML